MDFTPLDQLASTYDQDMETADQHGQFPYAGYAEVLHLIAEELCEAFPIAPVKVLDLGIGTGKLYQSILPETIRLVGVDGSKAMLEIARLRYPDATLLCHDLSTGLPDELSGERFDAIVATYFFHSLPLDKMLQTIKQLMPLLSPCGRIYIGDAMFLTTQQKRETQLRELENWREFAHYHVYEQILGRIEDHLALSFFEIAPSASVLMIENYHECTLHRRDAVIQYGQRLRSGGAFQGDPREQTDGASLRSNETLVAMEPNRRT
jgi:putative AdoMet-dependent methyltransferase